MADQFDIRDQYLNEKEREIEKIEKKEEMSRKRREKKKKI